jgi:two-component sensor histidine kinase
MSTMLADNVVPFDAVFNADALSKRPARAADLRAELRTMHLLAQEMVKSPAGVMDRFVELAIELCDAESGGISLLEARPDSPGIFRWYGLKGRFAAYQGGTTPRDFSPCGIVLDSVKPVVMNYPERHYPYLGADGLTIPELLLVPLLNTNDKAVGTLWIVHDEGGQFTKNEADTLERLAAFTSVGLMLSQAMAEKDKMLQSQEMLIKEANHRISNSLQLATSILHLQARREPDAAIRQKLEDAVQRVSSIARIHRRLYRTGEMATVELRQYLRDLSDEIADSVKGERNDREYHVNIQAPEFRIATDAATKIGIIVSELLTNAFKHGGDTRSCLASVTLKQPRPGWLSLTVADNGSGLPADYVLSRKKGLGTTILKTLTAQLGGTITVLPSELGGACFCVEFAIPPQSRL